VLEERTVPDAPVSDPLSISYAFETIGALIAHNLEQSVVLIRSRTSYVDAAMRNGALRAEPTQEKYDYDVFVAYDRKESEYARELIEALGGHGLRVGSEDQLEVGEASSRSVEDLVVRSRNMIAVLSAEPAPWLETEARRFVLGSVTEADPRLFIPVLRTPEPALAGSSTLMQFRAVDALERSPADVANELARALVSGEGANLLERMPSRYGGQPDSQQAGA
jgi:hypothetical protein